MEALRKCPLCGADIVLTHSNNSKQNYYKCSNSKCYFRLGMNYSEEEVSLQGIVLDTVCCGCGNPLTVVCGIKGLYATCLKCDCDTKPNMVNGFVFKKYANAHNMQAQEEIRELKENYKGIVNESYGFDDFLETEEKPKEVDIEETPNNELKGTKHSESIRDKILAVLSRKNEGMDSYTIAKELNVKITSIYGYLKNLRKLGKIKAVGYSVSKNGTARALLALKESNLPEIPIIKTGDTSYTTVNNFFKKHKDIIKKSKINSPTKFLSLVESYNLNYSLSYTKQGVRRCFLEQDLLKLINADEDNCGTNRASYGDVRNGILQFFNETAGNKGYSVADIASHTKLKKSSIFAELKRMRNKGEVKIVGSENSCMLFQLASNTLPELCVSSEEGLISIPSFFKKYKKNFSSIQELKAKIEEAKIPPHNIITKKGIKVGYSIALLEGILNTEGSKMESLDTLFSAKERSSKEIKPLKSSILKFISSVIPKKNKSIKIEPEETISF